MAQITLPFLFAAGGRFLFGTDYLTVSVLQREGGFCLAQITLPIPFAAVPAAEPPLARTLQLFENKQNIPEF